MNHGRYRLLRAVSHLSGVGVVVARCFCCLLRSFLCSYLICGFEFILDIPLPRILCTCRFVPHFSLLVWPSRFLFPCWFLDFIFWSVVASGGCGWACFLPSRLRYHLSIELVPFLGCLHLHVERWFAFSGFPLVPFPPPRVVWFFWASPSCVFFEDRFVTFFKDVLF